MPTSLTQPLQSFLLRFRARAAESIVPVLLLFCCTFLVGCENDKRTADGRLHLTYWAVWTGFEMEVMRDVVKRFNESQDRIYVEIISISQLEQKLLISTSGGNPPDIASLSAEFIPYFAQKNALRPLDGYTERAGIDAADYIDVFWDMGQYEGYTWALPIMGTCVAWHYNRSHFLEVGLDPEKPPVTLAELEALESKLNILKGDQVVRLAFLPSTSVPDWWPYCWPWFFGGELWNGSDKLTLTSPECIEAYEWVAALPTRINPDLVRPLRAGFGNLFASPQNPFLAGKLSSIFQGTWMANFVEKYAPEIQFEVAPMPVKDPKYYGTTIAEGDMIFIPAETSHPAESFEFIKYVASQESVERLCYGFKAISPLKTRSEGFVENHTNPNIEDFDAMVLGPFAKHAPKLSMWYEVLDEMGVVFDQMWLGQTTAVAGLTAAQNRLQTRLDQELEGWRLVADERKADWDAFVQQSRKGDPQP